MSKEIQSLIRDLDEARRRAGLSKADLARLAETQPASVRRLLSGNGHNPQVSTLAALADVLGHEIQIVPKSKDALAVASQKATQTEDAAADWLLLFADLTVARVGVEGYPLNDTASRFDASNIIVTD